MADLGLLLSGTRKMDGGIWGALIGFNEATLVLDKFFTFRALSCARAKPFTLFGMFVFQSTLHPRGALHSQTYIHNPFVQSHSLLKMK